MLFRRSDDFSLKLKFFIPLLLLLLILLLDNMATRFLGDQTFAPFLAVFSFFIMAGFIPCRWILLWLPFFAATSFWLILDSSQFPKTRTVTVILAGLLASWAAYFREKTNRQSREIEMILGNLPTPWLLISREGAVLKANRRGAALLGSTSEEIVGHSIFKFSLNEEERRLLIHDFVKINKDSITDSGVDLPLGRLGTGGKNILCRIFPLPSLNEKPLLMVLEVS